MAGTFGAGIKYIEHGQKTMTPGDANTTSTLAQSVVVAKSVLKTNCKVGRLKETVARALASPASIGAWLGTAGTSTTTVNFSITDDDSSDATLDATSYWTVIEYY